MELKLIKIKDRKNLYYEKIYRYGKFNISVDIDINNENNYMITAEDDKKECDIMMSNNDECATMHFSFTYVTLKNAEEFLETVVQGTEVLKLLQEKRMEIIKKE